MSRPSAKAPHICIVGGGFGGLYTALYLQKYRHLKTARITLIEPNDQFVFTPMMYELITDELKQWELFPTYSSLLAKTTVNWQQTSATSVNLAHQTVTGSNDEVLSYDYLVLATGAQSRKVPVPGVDEHALAFRSMQDALTLQVRLAQLVAGKRSGQLDRSINVCVIGGGASGVELACKVADYLGPRGQVSLIERGDALLTPFPNGIRRQAMRSLRYRKVHILLETSVAAIDANAVTIEQGDQQSELTSDVTLWAVGTQPRPWLGEQSVPHTEQGQRKTRRSLQLVDYDNVFVLGDSADVRGLKGKAAPNTAQAAFQAANQVAANLAAITQGKTPKPFNYLHLGDMITLGIGNAGLHSFGITLGGRLAALIRRGVYVFRMPTRRHQLKVGRRALAELVRAVLPPWSRANQPCTVREQKRTIE
ncbi:MAG: NAD(P)/FAD-dependent oxidoreductase [Cyanobacteria bacterium J06634_6]